MRLIIIRASVVEMLILIVEEGRHPGLIFAVETGIARTNVVESFRILGASELYFPENAGQH